MRCPFAIGNGESVGIFMVSHFGVDIKPTSMNIDMNEVKHSLVNLKSFVDKSKLMWGISNDYVFNDNFFNEMIPIIQDSKLV